jgi:hypothetical protein
MVQGKWVMGKKEKAGMIKMGWASLQNAMAPAQTYSSPVPGAISLHWAVPAFLWLHE